MVAVIHSGSSLRRALNYNEQKVQQEAAVCIAAVNYPKDAEDLTFYQKLNRLQNQAELNIRTKVNCVHISLNFDPSEKFSSEKLKEISDGYLQKTGFANQPYCISISLRAFSDWFLPRLCSSIRFPSDLILVVTICT